MIEITIQPNGSRIKSLRIAKRWSQEDFAAKVGCSKRTIENAEAGRRIKESSLRDIAGALKEPFVDLVVSGSPIAPSPNSAPLPVAHNDNGRRDWQGHPSSTHTGQPVDLTQVETQHNRDELPTVINDIMASRTGGSHKIYMRRQEVDWGPYNERVGTIYWAAGTSLRAVLERGLIKMFFDKGVKDIKIILPATEPNMLSFHQLDLYNKLGGHQLADDQVRAAEDSYKKLLGCIRDTLQGRESDYIRLYSGIMHSNITIFDDDAFRAFYDSTGIGENNFTYFCNKRENEHGYGCIEEEFLRMWDAWNANLGCLKVRSRAHFSCPGFGPR